jgi:hypothetical protein
LLASRFEFKSYSGLYKFPERVGAGHGGRSIPAGGLLETSTENLYGREEEKTTTYDGGFNLVMGNWAATGR